VTAHGQDLHEIILAEIEGRISTLRAGAPAARPDGGAWTDEEVRAEVAHLSSDRDLILAHWKTLDGVVGAAEPTRARACGQPQPCPHTLGLAQKYHVI